MPTIEGKPDAAAPRKRKEVRYDTAISAPGNYEVTRSSTFAVKIPMKVNADKWWVLVDEEYAEVVEEAVFRMWTYDEMVDMRKMSTVFDQLRRVHMIDHDILNRLKIQRLMTAWSFAKGNPRLAIHHANGVLTDESWDAVRRMQTNIVRFLIEQMNERLEL